jgi:hypothetical protein
MTTLFDDLPDGARAKITEYKRNNTRIDTQQAATIAAAAAAAASANGIQQQAANGATAFEAQPPMMMTQPMMTQPMMPHPTQLPPPAPQ